MKSILLFLLFNTPLFIHAQTNEDIGIGVKKGNNTLSLAERLGDEGSNEQEKANAIYNWVTNNIVFDVRALTVPRPPETDPDVILNKGKATSSEYARLVKALCEGAGLSAVIISGYQRDWKFDDGDTLYSTNHYWNGVKINNKWYLLDAEEGAGKLYSKLTGLQKFVQSINKKKVYTSTKLFFKKEYNPAYFMQSPLTFRETRIADDPLWQLTKTAMPITVFQNGLKAIQEYNKINSDLKNEYNGLNEFAALPEQEQADDSETRILSFNPRNTEEIGVKYFRLAIKDTKKALKKKNKYADDEKEVNLERAQKDLSKASSFLSLSQKEITNNYKSLNTKNTFKKKYFTGYKDSIIKSNKDLAKEINKRLKTHKTVYKTIVTKKGKQSKNEILDIDYPTDMPSAANNPEAKKIADAISARNAKIAVDKYAATDLLKNINKLLDVQDKQWESFKDNLATTQQTIVAYAKSKAKSNDHMDAELYDLEVELRKNKSQNTYQQTYLQLHDSINNMYQKHYELNKTLAADYQANMKDAANYLKRFGNKEPLVTRYSEYADGFSNALDAQNENQKDQIDYFNNTNKALQWQLREYKMQNLYIEQAKKMEEARFDFTKKMLKKEQLNSKKVNANNKKYIARFSKNISQLIKQAKKSK